MRQPFKSVIVCVCTVATVMLFGCKSPQQVKESNSGGEGVATLQIHAAPNSPFQKIARTAVAVVSASDMLSMTKSLTVTDSSVEGLIKGIPAGKARLFQVFVYDSLEVMQYKGSATANVIADSTVKVTINIVRIGGNAIINGNVIDSIIDPGTKVNPNLVAYWSFDTIINAAFADNSGHGHTATFTGTGIATAPGIKSKALSCPGSGYEIVATNTKNDFVLSQFTIETWFYANTDPTLFGFSKIIDFQAIESGVYNGFGIHIDPQGNINFSTSNSTGSAWEVAQSQTSLVSKTWYHIACTFNGTILKIFLNGALDGSFSYSGTFYPPNVDAHIGGQKLTSGTVRYLIDGKLDEFKVYNIALPADSIAAHYAVFAH